MNAYELAVVLGVVSSSPIAQSQEARLPIDVIVSVTSANLVPGYVNRTARNTASRMFARLGVRLAWLDDKPGNSDAFASPVVVQVLFTRETPSQIHKEALAYASPFTEGGNIIVLWERIRIVAERPELEGPILAHVLAHEIGHVLKGTNGHAPTGVMKARWNRKDYDAMAKRPLEFTSADADLIRQRLDRLRARAGITLAGPS